MMMVWFLPKSGAGLYWQAVAIYGHVDSPIDSCFINLCHAPYLYSILVCDYSNLSQFDAHNVSASFPVHDCIRHRKTNRKWTNMAKANAVIKIGINRTLSICFIYLTHWNNTCDICFHDMDSFLIHLRKITYPDMSNHNLLFFPGPTWLNRSSRCSWYPWYPRSTRSYWITRRGWQRRCHCESLSLSWKKRGSITQQLNTKNTLQYIKINVEK